MNPLFTPPLTGYKLPAARLALAFMLVYPCYYRLRYGSWL